MTALYWRVTLARVENSDRECLWTYKRLVEKTRVIWRCNGESEWWCR